MPLHSALTGAELHEPKGADTATVDKVYVSTGTGSGNWQKIESDQIDTTSIQNVNKIYLQGVFADISTAEDIYIAVPNNAFSSFDGWYIKDITVILANAITVASAVVTVYTDLVTTGTWVSKGTVTVTVAGSGSGAVYSSVLSGQQMNVVIGGSHGLKISTDGGSTTACKAYVTICLSKTDS